MSGIFRYDRDADACYITISSGKRIEKTDEIETGILVDLDASDDVVGVEILNLSDRLKSYNSNSDQSAS